MNVSDKKEEKNSWIIGGTTLMGVGDGFIFLATSALYFVASILVGVGMGLLIEGLISIKKD